MSDPAERLQVSLFLTEPVATAIQTIRAEFDPRSAAAIRPHITVLYENELTKAAPQSDLSKWALTRRRFGVELSEPRLWGKGPDEGIYLGVADVEDGISSLRHHVLSRDPSDQPTIEYVPHVTLIHADCVDRASAVRGWNNLRQRGGFGWCARDGMSLIQHGETHGAKWLASDSVSADHG
jgi:2'-5' RNA ligase